MKQISVLVKSKLKDKSKIYSSFFGFKTPRGSYWILCLKQIFSFVFSSIITFYFIHMLLNHGLYGTYIYLILGLLGLVQLMFSSRSATGFINTFLPEYQMSSSEFFGFFYKTAVSHVLAQVVFKLTSIVPMIVVALLINAKLGFSILIGVLIGFFLQLNVIIKRINRYHNMFINLSDKIFSFIKFSFGLSAAIFFFNVIFHLVKVSLGIARVIFTSSTYNEDLLLNELLLSVLGKFTWLKNIAENNSFLLIKVVSFCILLTFINEVYKYIGLWRGEIIIPRQVTTPKEHLGKNNLPFTKQIYSQKLNTLLGQIKKQPEIIFWIFLQYIITKNIDRDISKAFLIIWLFYIGNTNYLRSLFVNGSKAFSNYAENLDLYYWRLSGLPVLSLYEQKLELLLSRGTFITVLQVGFSCFLSLWFIQNKLLSLLVCLLVLLTAKSTYRFNGKLVSFSSFFVFSNSCKAGVTVIENDENEFLESKLHNLYKLPFTIIPMILLGLEYIYRYLNIPILLGIFMAMYVLIKIIKKTLFQYITKGGGTLEKISIRD